MKLAQVGAIFYALWGILHVIGGTVILLALADGTAAGFAMYENAGGSYPDAAGAILGMSSFMIAIVGAVVVVVAVRLNWRNSQLGALLNLILAGGSDSALVLYLLVPGFVSASDALTGLGLLAGAILFSGVALMEAQSVARHLEGGVPPARPA